MKNYAMTVSTCALLALTGCREKTAPPPPPPVPVVASEVLVRDQYIYLDSIGQSLGAQDVRDVALFAPSLNFVKSAQINQIAIRGLGSPGLDEFESAVGAIVSKAKAIDG